MVDKISMAWMIAHSRHTYFTIHRGLYTFQYLSDLICLEQEAIVPEAGFYLEILGVGYMLCPLATLAWRE